MEAARHSQNNFNFSALEVVAILPTVIYFFLGGIGAYTEWCFQKNAASVLKNLVKLKMDPKSSIVSKG
jgi:hypothetical protein